MREGLRIVGILPLIEAHPSVWKKFFVYANDTITAEAFKGLFKDETPTEFPNDQAYKWFMAYIDQAEETCEGTHTYHM